MTILGLDPGERRIGMAISPDGRVAVSLGVLESRGMEEDLAQLSEIIVREGVTEIVVGLPRQLDGEMGKAAEKTLDFARALQEKFRVPVKTWDERLTTVSAERALLEGDLSRRKRRGLRDKVAATLILQAFLDRRRIDSLRRGQDGHNGDESQKGRGADGRRS